MKIHLDTDIGGDIDDLLALSFLLKHHQAEITGITTVAENKGKRAGYVKHVLTLVNREDIQLKAGADVSDGYYRFKPGYPNEFEYWEAEINNVRNDLSEAIELLKQSVEQGAAIVCIGPYTNIRLLIEMYPELRKKLNLFVMGGYLGSPKKDLPQWGNEMDYNVQLDIESAKFVFENLKPTIVPLNISMETYITHSDVEKLEKGDALCHLIAKQAKLHDLNWENSEKMGKQFKSLPNDFINFQYDPLTCAIALGWEGIKTENKRLDIYERDSYLVEIINRNGAEVNLVTEINGVEFNKLWLETVTGSL